MREPDPPRPAPLAPACPWPPFRWSACPGSACTGPACIGSACISLLAALLLGGCTAAAYAGRADTAAERIQADGFERTLASRETTVLRPVQIEPGIDNLPATTQHLVLDLEQTLSLAIAGNRDYQTQLESLYLTALSLTGAQNTFSPRMRGLLGYVFADGKGLSQVDALDASLGVTKILHWGGTLALDAATTVFDAEGAPETYSSSLSVRLAQPLLRGAGFEASHNVLIQAEREVLYATRDFELFREDFSIDVAARYYGLVQTTQQLNNQEENLERAAYDRRKAEALFDVGRENEVVVLRAKRQELNSRNALLSVKERFARELEDFAIFLGLPRGTTIEVVPKPPPYVPVRYDMNSAVEVAVTNRLDLMNLRERLEDSERAVRIARNGLLPDLTVNLDAGLASAPVTDFDGQQLNEDMSAGFTLSLPLDRVGERNAFRDAQIQLDRARRNYELTYQNVALVVRSAIRELERRQLSVQITEQLIRGEAKNKRIAELQFERGNIDNRELVDAEQSLLNARNALIDEQVSYEIARLRLLRNMGVLFIDEQGMWTE